MKTRRLSASIVAAALVAAIVPALAQASTESQRRAWARSPAQVYSHGTSHDNVCSGSARFRRDNGTWANAYGENEGACTAQFTAFPVHREGRVVVKTRPEVRALTIAVVTSHQPLRVRDARSCVEFAPGRWECRMPPPGGEGSARLTLQYPGAFSSKHFTYTGHSPNSH